MNAIDASILLSAWRAAFSLALAAQRWADVYELAVNVRDHDTRGTADLATACALLDDIDAALMATRPPFAFSVGDRVQSATEYDDPRPGVIAVLNGDAVAVRWDGRNFLHRTTTAHLVPFGVRPWSRELDPGDEDESDAVADDLDPPDPWQDGDRGAA